MRSYVIDARNVNDALYTGLIALKSSGLTADSRNGMVLRAEGPVLTSYNRPLERVLFSALRDANPFFHLYEAVWMLAGSNDAPSVARYAANMAMYSDDGKTLHGAYGYRWRKFFGTDQLLDCIKELKRDPASRRVVLTMWDPGNKEYDSGGYHRAAGDMEVAVGSTGKPGLDVPCNTHCYFDLQSGVLNMTICCRSNDAVWGAHGANAVHFSYLLDFMAAAVQVQVGRLYQLSNNYHAYINRPDVERLLGVGSGGADVPYMIDCRYSERLQYAEPLIALGYGQRTGAPVEWLHELELFAAVDLRAGGEYPHSDKLFLTEIFAPMMRAHAMFRSGGDAIACDEFLRSVPQRDWITAGREWLGRRFATRTAFAEANKA
jgi:Thymidylate synthase